VSPALAVRFTGTGANEVDAGGDDDVAGAEDVPDPEGVTAGETLAGELLAGAAAPAPPQPVSSAQDASKNGHPASMNPRKAINFRRCVNISTYL